MEEGMGHSRGSMNPWAESEEYLTKPNWNNINGFETPFGAMAEILQSWPGTTQTSEQDDDERHLRLISTIAGYPEILTGRRPLDIPLHKKSELAFKLSEFLDCIKPDSHSEWHSLRSLLLHHDLVHFSHRKKKTAKEILECLITSIRNYSTFGETRESYNNQQFHDEELMFLTSLHSHTNRRIKQFWPERLIDLNFNPMTPNTDVIFLNSRNERRNFCEYTFTFDEIHKWIRNWSSPKNENLLNANFAQKWIIASSAILESLFAKLRSHIIDEKRPGSIVIDGGGRISYISEETRENEHKWFKEKLYTSFLQDNIHPHPYAKTISDQIKHYARREQGIILDTIKSNVIEDDFQSLWHQGDLPNPELKNQPTRKMFQALIGERTATHFIPRVVVDPSKNREDRERFLIDPNSVKSWIFTECVICNNSSEIPESVSSCKKIIEEGLFVCPFHYLFGGLAENVIVRQTSFSDLFLKQYEKFEQGEKEVSHILRFDGNSIGLNFKKEFKEYNTPEYDTYSEIWENERNKILDIESKWDLPEQNHNLSDSQKAKQKNLLFERRLQVLIRKQRRSYSFNSKWWTALRKAMKTNGDCNLIPWILAGDDIVLVNQSKTDEIAITSFLRDFHSILEKALGERITFAGSLQQRGHLSIIECFNQAEELEESASLVWKKLASSDFPELLDDDKRRELDKEWEPAVHTEILDWINSKSAFNFKYGSKKKPNSIIIPSNWKDHSSS